MNRYLSKSLVAMSLGLLGLTHTPKAEALDGCKLLLCLAGNWSAIPLCVPDVRQLFRDLARGRPFPSCSMSGGGNFASNNWISPSFNCPLQYTIWGLDNDGNRVITGCQYNAYITTTVKGQPWSTVYWSFGGGTVSQYSAIAKEQMGAYTDLSFERDYAAWWEAEQKRLADEEAARNSNNGGGN